MTDLAGAIWRKATRSNAGGDCVEVAETPDAVGVRDSKNPTGPVLAFDRDAWRAFIDGAKQGEFD